MKPEKEKRPLPPPRERAPLFLIIGAQKAGTQALRYNLAHHPHIEVPQKVPETHYFDKHYFDDQTGDTNLKYYARVFFDRDCSKEEEFCVSGEATPIYLCDTKRVPSRVLTACPWVKLIVVLRDPVKRMYSHYNMLTTKNEINATFEEHLNFDLEWMREVHLHSSLSRQDEDKAWLKYISHKRWKRLMLGRGMYEIQLRRWFQFFPRDQFLILKSDEFRNDGTQTMRRVYRFLGLEEHQMKKISKIHARNYTIPVSDELESFLYDFYRPYNQRLERLLGPEWKGIWGSDNSTKLR